MYDICCWFGKHPMLILPFARIWQGLDNDSGLESGLAVSHLHDFSTCFCQCIPVWKGVWCQILRGKERQYHYCEECYNPKKLFHPKLGLFHLELLEAMALNHFLGKCVWIYLMRHTFLEQESVCIMMVINLVHSSHRTIWYPRKILASTFPFGSVEANPSSDFSALKCEPWFVHVFQYRNWFTFFVPMNVI